MDIKRTLLWAIFSIALLVVYNDWSKNHDTPALSANASKAANTSAPVIDVPAAPATKTTQTPQIAPEKTPADKAESVTITTDIIKARFSSVGGQLEYLELLKHRDTVKQNNNMVLFDKNATHTYLAQTGLVGGAFPNHQSHFTIQDGPRDLGTGDTLTLTMVAQEGDVTLTKKITFKRGDYVIDIKHTVDNHSSTAITPSLYLQLVRDDSKPAGESALYSTFTGPAIFTQAEKFQKVDFEKIDKGAEHAKHADNGWTALIQHYFVSAFIPADKTPRDIFTRKVSSNLYAIGSVSPLGSIAPQASITTDARLYAGPQESHVLEKTASGLELVKDYGLLTMLSKPIFWLMEQIERIVGNWGWTIIILTILIKLAFFPLSAASYRSMAKMKLVTPKMTALRERYKSEPQKMNQAMMELYKTEKINPLGGCLPILVQIPVFIALYWVLLASVEVRNAPWLGWITDLAAPDPYYILPLIMAASMFIQTKLNPTPADPMQAKIMMVMPIVFSFMFFFFPSGLVLYWVVNNILSIAQQWVITKNVSDNAPAANNH